MKEMESKNIDYPQLIWQLNVLEKHMIKTYDPSLDLFVFPEGGDGVNHTLILPGVAWVSLFIKNAHISKLSAKNVETHQLYELDMDDITLEDTANNRSILLHKLRIEMINDPEDGERVRQMMEYMSKKIQR